MSTPALVRSIAPEFAGKTDAEIQVFLDIAILDTAAAVWGVRFDGGAAYLAAHLMTVSTRSGVSGPITEEQVGDLRRRYGFSEQDSDPLRSTSYGNVYYRMRRGIVRSPMVGCT